MNLIYIFLTDDMIMVLKAFEKINMRLDEQGNKLDELLRRASPKGLGETQEFPPNWPRFPLESMTHFYAFERFLNEESNFQFAVSLWFLNCINFFFFGPF